MNEKNVIAAILNGYIETANTPGLSPRQRSERFVENATRHIRSVFNLPNQCTLSRPCNNPISNMFPAGRQELLFDIHSFEYETTASPGAGSELLVIRRSLLQLESEMPDSNNYRELFDDYNKLVCGDAEMKVFVCPNPDAGLGVNHIAAFNAVAKYIQGSLYIVALPHLRWWNGEITANTPTYKVYRKNLIGQVEVI